MIGIEPHEGDDLEFIEMVERFATSYIDSNEPDSVYLLKIDHWFDFKWKEFEGKMLGALGSWNSEFLRLPPFIPDRVVDQVRYERVEGTYEVIPGRQVHVYQSSGENITGQGRLVGSWWTRMFIWFSGGSRDSQRGSLMLYFIEKENSKSVYVSFLKKKQWQIFKTDGISRNEAKHLVSS